MLGKSLFTNDSYMGALGTKSGIDGSIFEPGYSVIVLRPTINRLFKDDKESSVIGIMKDNFDIDYNNYSILSCHTDNFFFNFLLVFYIFYLLLYLFYIFAYY
jgi:hypothetical protein